MSEPRPAVTVGRWTLVGPARVVGFALAVAAVGLAASQALPLAAFAVLHAAGVTLPSLLAVGVSIVLTELVGFGGATWVYLRLRGLDADYVYVRWPTARDVGWMVGGTVLVLALYFGVVGAAVALGAPVVRSGISLYGEREPAGLLLIAVLSVVLVGPMEELFFRGVVQETMREALSPTAAVLLSSLAFAAVHLLTLVGPLTGQLVVVGSLFVTALVLGYAYERTRNLAVNAVVHGGYNAVLLVVAYWAFTSGAVPTG